MVEHQLGDSIQDCVIGSSVRDGVSMRCGQCRKGCVIELPRGTFTNQSDMQGVTFFCPYCGEQGRPLLPNRIIDIRPVGFD